jgi:PTH1 family peptidyl-tRNA hydrolase
MSGGKVKLIVGLGNPGPRYAQNRHNVGYQCIERLAQSHGLALGRIMFKAYVTSGHIAGIKTVLARPLTFMNLSGQAVRPLLRWYRIALADLLVIYDDLDLPLGKIRLREQGGSGGHKGMRSIIEALGTEAFPRLRVGIGRPVHGEPSDHVLNDFAPDECIVMDGTLDQAVAAVETFIATGIRAAMNSHNIPPEDVAPDVEELAPPKRDAESRPQSRRSGAGHPSGEGAPA